MYIGLSVRQRFAEDICEKYQDMEDERRDLIKNRLRIKNCTLVILPTVIPEYNQIDSSSAQSEDTNSKKVIMVVTLTAVSSLLLLVFLLYLSRWLWKKRKFQILSKIEFSENEESTSILDEDQIWDYSKLIVVVNIDNEIIVSLLSLLLLLVSREILLAPRIWHIW